MHSEHKGTALKEPTFRGHCFHHRVTGKYYLKIPLDGYFSERAGAGGVFQVFMGKCF